MGTDVHAVLTGAGAHELTRVQDRIAMLEARWSRFVPASEISRLNDNAGYPTVCSRETIALIERALLAWRFTGGRFDPTVLGAVRRAGYDVSYETLPAARASVDGDRRETGAAGIVVDAATNLVVVPAGVGFDPGGIGKGYAADIVGAEAMARGATGACINVGGDLRALGDAPNGGAWTVDVLDPFDGRVRDTVAVADGAVATSSRARRTWMLADKVVHHLVDPATAVPVENDVVAVTVVASEGWRAEVLAKAVFVAGVDDGLRFLDDPGAAGALFDREGVLHGSRDWARFSCRASTASC